MLIILNFLCLDGLPQENTFLAPPSPFGNEDDDYLPETGHLDELIEKIVSREYTYLRFSVNEQILQAVAKKMGYEIRERESTERFRKIWTVVEKDEIIGEIHICTSFIDHSTSFLSFKDDSVSIEWMKQICILQKMTADCYSKKALERRRESKTNTDIESVFKHNAEKLRQYPFLQKQDRPLYEFEEHVGLELGISGLFRNEILGWIGPNIEINIMDLSCGKGNILKSIKQNLSRTRNKVNFTGVDPSDNPFDPSEGIEFYKGYGERLPDNWTNRFHLITCSQGMNYMADPARTLEEIHRVLAPGGIAIIDIDHLDFYFSEDDRGTDWFYYQGLDYLLNMGFTITSNGRSLVIKKNRYNIPLVFPVSYIRPLFHTVSGSRIVDAIRTYYYAREFQHLTAEDIGDVELYKGAIYTEWDFDPLQEVINSYLGEPIQDSRPISTSI